MSTESSRSSDSMTNTETTFADKKDGLDSIEESTTNTRPRALTRHESLIFNTPANSEARRRYSAVTDTHIRNHFLRVNRFTPRRVRNRLIQKNGVSNIQPINVPKQSRKYFNDLFTTLTDVRWRYCLALFAASYIASWLSFATLFYFFALAHGDFQHAGEEAWVPCINNGYSFLSIIMFSVESQSTIGYGSRYPTEECPLVVITVCLQNMVGVITQTMMAGVVFAKLARPKKRAQTIMFSKNAVICMRDGKLCLLFRLGDMRQSQLAEAHVRLQMVKKYITKESELLPFYQHDMNVGYDEGLDRVFVIWPITICHVIDEKSPLYDVSKADLEDGKKRFEIIAILEGVVESTGSTTQARTSYLPSEITWGHRFEKLVTYQRENGEYRTDFSLFHNTVATEMPTFSAKELDELEEQGLDPMAEWLKRNPTTTHSNGGPMTLSIPSIKVFDEADGHVHSGNNNLDTPTDSNVYYTIPNFMAKSSSRPRLETILNSRRGLDTMDRKESVSTLDSVDDELEETRPRNASEVPVNDIRLDVLDETKRKLSV